MDFAHLWFLDDFKWLNDASLQIQIDIISKRLCLKVFKIDFIRWKKYERLFERILFYIRHFCILYLFWRKLSGNSSKVYLSAEIPTTEIHYFEEELLNPAISGKDMMKSKAEGEIAWLINPSEKIFYLVR